MEKSQLGIDKTHKMVENFAYMLVSIFSWLLICVSALL